MVRLNKWSGEPVGYKACGFAAPEMDPETSHQAQVPDWSLRISHLSPSLVGEMSFTPGGTTP